MCHTTTPIHSCTHFGPSIVSVACAAGTSSRACHSATDTGCRNVATLCPSCRKAGLGMRGVQGVGLMGMLNQIDAAVSTASSRASGSGNGSGGKGSSGATPPTSGVVTPALTSAGSSSVGGADSGASTPPSSDTGAVTVAPVLEQALAVLESSTAPVAAAAAPTVVLGVPDLGFLGDLGEPVCAKAEAAAEHGRRTVQTFNLHWRAFAERNNV